MFKSEKLDWFFQQLSRIDTALKPFVTIASILGGILAYMSDWSLAGVFLAVMVSGAAVAIVYRAMRPVTPSESSLSQKTSFETPDKDHPIRISLHDFLYVEAIKYGWQRAVDDQKDFAALLLRLRQAAIDSKVPIWGKRSPINNWEPITLAQAPLLPIPGDYWCDHEFDIVTAIFQEENSKIYSQRQFDTDRFADERYFDLHLGRSEVLAWIQTSEGQPSSR